MAALAELLGKSLLGQGGEVKETASALAGKGAVALYFSAHWCPPCRGFTPQLAKWYTSDLQAKGLEVVFVSSDRDEGSFREYFAEQPWLALPFAESAIKDRLSKKFKIQGIPSLVIVDSEGKTITKEGRSVISEDPKGGEFPWRPKPVKELLSGAKLIGPSGESTIGKAVEGKKALALYFSAHWCPPCRGFTPQLAEWYKKDLQAKGLEVVFISSDRDEKSFKEYFAEQPWLALDFSDRKTKDKVSSAMKVDGIPALVILDADLNVVTQDGRGAVCRDPTGAELPWYPKPLKDLAAGPGNLNEVTTLVVFCEGCDAAATKSVEQALEPLAVSYIEKAKAAGDDEDADFEIMLATKGADLASRIRSMVGLPTAAASSGAVRMALLDIPDNGGYYIVPEGTEVTAAKVEEFLASYKAGTLERKQLAMK